MIYEGLGFPIELVNAPIRNVLGEPVLDVDLKWLQATVFRLLLDVRERFTGAQVRFVRHSMELTQARFADLLGLSNHSVVSQWESRSDALAGMDKSVELLLRLQMARHLDDDGAVKRWLDQRRLAEEPARVEVRAA
jgi:DNA-binding XRE family transcriptional regulator